MPACRLVPGRGATSVGAVDADEATDTCGLALLPGGPVVSIIADPPSAAVTGAAF